MSNADSGRPMAGLHVLTLKGGKQTLHPRYSDGDYIIIDLESGVLHKLWSPDALHWERVRFAGETGETTDAVRARGTPALTAALMTLKFKMGARFDKRWAELAEDIVPVFVRKAER